MLAAFLARPDEAGARARRAAAFAEAAPPHRLIAGHATFSGAWMSDLSVQTQYAHLTDALIHSILTNRPDTVIFLDKSARPVAWLVNAFWSLCALTEPDGGAPIPPRPRFCFLNIDRRQWRDVMDPIGTGGYSVEHVPEPAIAGLRRAFLHRDCADLPDDAVYDHEPPLLGSRLFVVDEVKVSGNTLSIAAALIGRAFPGVEVATEAWMAPSLKKSKDGNRYNNQLPVWYREESALGRLVGDRDPEAALRSSSWRVRSAAWFTSLPHAERDVDGVALRTEVRQLLGDVLLGRVPLIPGFEREIADIEARSLGLTGRTAAQLRDWREANAVLLAT